MDNLPRSASVVALDEVYLNHVTRDDFQRMLSRSTKLDLGMLRKLSARLREADDLITTTTHARRSLRSQVDELAAENQQLMELQRLREQTTDLVVHDLRNPLHCIMGAAGMLQMILSPAVVQENRDLFNLINANCERMQHLVDSLLDISRMESGETELMLEPVNLAQLSGPVARERSLPLSGLDHVKGNPVFHRPPGIVALGLRVEFDPRIRIEALDACEGRAADESRIPIRSL